MVQSVLPTYACTYMDDVKTEFLKTQERTPLVWFRHDEEHLEIFLQELNNFNPDLKLTYESNEKEIPFLELKLVSAIFYQNFICH